MAGSDFSFLLEAGPEAGAAARRAVVASDGALPAAVREDMLLLVTELVTNGVRHGCDRPDQSLRLGLRLWPRGVRVEVVDPGAGFVPAGARLPYDRAHGWGLFLVDRIADRWGVTPAPDGTCVWFELSFEG